MLLCALVGLALVVAGSWALPRPTTVVSAQVAAPTASVPAAAPATGSAPTAPQPASPTPTPTPVARGTGTAQAATRPVPATGPGTYSTAGVSMSTRAPHGHLYTYDVRVERGLDLDPDEVARAVQGTLDDPRSWRYTRKVRFSLVPAGKHAELHAYVVTPGTTDRLCAPLRTRGDVSCRAGSKVVLNARRWVGGADDFGPDDAAYRHYLVNHEFGHALGHHHVGCPHPGDPAPVMLQQTKGLQGCAANPWPSVTRG